MIVLGIESSCDETSVAISRDGRHVAGEIYSQKIHAEFGGVVPELASRAHILKIDRLTALVLQRAGFSMADINAIAVTDSPGLAGALLVGVSFAMGLHAGFGIPVYGINHLEGHICSALIENPGLAFPFLALVVSGGHTSIFTVTDIGTYTCLGQTVDDAAGEAFDKVGKLMGFTYPAGRSIETAASEASERTLRFPVSRPGEGLDFSFSGLKTATKYYLESRPRPLAQVTRNEVCFAFQEAVVESLSQNLREASRVTGINRVALVGGVACNGRLRERLGQIFESGLYMPSAGLCTDNAAMIARAGYERIIRGLTRDPHMSPSQPLA